ncbi:MAG: PilZ domain-containing protein [Phycisphaerales bacterium]
MSERRQAARVAIERPCRLRRRSGARFEHARTLDVSTRGALIELDSTHPASPGDSISVAVAWNRSPVVTGSSFVSARVVRADATGPRSQRLGVEFVGTAAADTPALAA